ncbi:MAG: PEP-CTERM-box response regulator transcription factor [Syntrophaceae bacterium]
MEQERILIVEDESSMAKQLKWGLSDEYDVEIAADAAQADAYLQVKTPAIVLLDLGLPPFPDGAEEGLRVLDEIVRRKGAIKVIVITGNTQRETAVRAISMGAYDFHQKPVVLDELKVILKRAIYLSKLERQVSEYKGLVKDTLFEGMIATTRPMMQLFELARKVARTDFPVLIQGDSGTGKERLAQAIHNLSARSEAPFVIVDCGSIPENLIESELFGHEKGSFTGAHARQIGKIERARGGTLVLDEIGELPLALQVKLLRFLQESTIERIGGKEPIRVDTRVIAVTNVNLKEAVQDQRFREDLFYRLNVVPLVVPPLKERNEDIPHLANHFLKVYSQEIGRRLKGFHLAAIDAMLAYHWPGNVRELQNRIRRAVVVAEGTHVESKDLDLGTLVTGKRTLKDARDAAELAVIKEALARQNYNITKAAQELDISRPTLHDLIKKHDISIA